MAAGGYGVEGRRNDGKHSSAIPRRDAPGLCRNHSPRKTEGAGNAGCPMHPQPVCKGRKHTVVTTGSPVSAGIPCTMVLTAYSALSPATNSSCHRRRRIGGLAGPGRARKTSADLTPATGARTTRLHRTQQCRSSARPSIAHEPKPALRPRLRARRCRVHRIPHPTSVTIAIRPSFGTGYETSKPDLGPQRSGFFLRTGLDTQINKLPVGQITEDDTEPCSPEIAAAASPSLLPIMSNNVCCSNDGVAKVPKCRATNFPLKDETSGKRRPMSLQARHRSSL
jgi:hypothetical protein